MGKYGAFELNYSSDIDLIVFYDLARIRLRAGLEVQPFFVRITRDLVRLLNERTGDGYVFRTDLRLRPDPGATPLALSTEAALNYYESFGQNWERAALIKARPVAGDLAAGGAILDELAPYIWRKYLDFAAIADIHAMKRQIHAFHGFGSIGVAGHNIKVGRGGIREIEFFVQTQQLIAGGRQPELRVCRDARRLAAAGGAALDHRGARAELDAAYRFLRTVEHRLQMIADEQTQTLPEDADKLLGLARFCGFADTAAFASRLTAELERVQAHYVRLFEHSPRSRAAAPTWCLPARPTTPPRSRRSPGWATHAPRRSSPWCAAGTMGATRPCARPEPASC
jgi:glutamate-ammonia-ligase adenylyltransferase